MSSFFSAGCGIVGSVNCGLTSETIGAMTDTLAHRGPDGRGVWSNDNGTVRFGHRRLAIVGMDAHSGQPMSRAGVTITCNGEIYNYPALRRELEGLGYVFTSGCDIEAELHAYAHWGTDCLKKLNGVFAFGLYDARKNQLLLARDAVGVKPLVYCDIGASGLLFASEAKALLASGLVAKRPNFATIRADLISGLLGSKHETWFEGIHQLEPGHAMIIDCGSGRRKLVPFWVYPEAVDRRGEREIVAELRELFDSAVKMQLMSDVGVSVTCSGGIDSAALTATALRAYGRPLDAFTLDYDDDVAGGGSAAQEDLRHARSLAAMYPDVNLHVVPISMRKLIEREQIDRLVRAFDGAVPMDIRVLSYVDLYRQIREHGHKVTLTGQGADEMWLGYYDDPIYTFYQYNAEQLSAEALAHRFFLPRLSLDAWNPAFLNRDLALAAYRQTLELNYTSYKTDDPLQRLSRFVLRTHFQAILAADDKIAMQAGIETRVPWVDTRMVHLAFTVPGFVKLNGPDATRKPKWLVRQAVRGTIPDAIIERAKAPFPEPPRGYKAYLQHAMANDVHRMESSPFLREIYSREHLSSFARNEQITERNLFALYILFRFGELYEL